MAAVADEQTDQGSDPWLVHTDGPVSIRCFDRRAGSIADPVELSPALIDAPPRGMHQVHGCSVAFIGAPGDTSAPPPEADALVSDQRPVSLVVRTADCVPLLMWDASAGVTAAVHAGWRGLVAGVVPQTVAAMVELGADPSRIRGWIGPSICGACYPVGTDVQAQVVGAAPGAGATARTGEPSVDVAAGVVEQLTARGVVGVVRDTRCTRETPDLYSARGGDAVDRLRLVVTLS